MALIDSLAFTACGQAACLSSARRVAHQRELSFESLVDDGRGDTPSSIGGSSVRTAVHARPMRCEREPSGAEVAVKMNAGRRVHRAADVAAEGLKMVTSALDHTGAAQSPVAFGELVWIASTSPAWQRTQTKETRRGHQQNKALSPAQMETPKRQPHRTATNRNHQSRGP
jgi:hypothetical protein